jgi:hypothetical protein
MNFIFDGYPSKKDTLGELGNIPNQKKLLTLKDLTYLQRCLTKTVK